MAHVHFIGIGGSGLSAIARLLLESGDTVTGSDRVLSPFAADLQAAGAKVTIGHQPENVTGADWVVRSSAVADDNPEVQAALQAGIPVYKRADFLGRLMSKRTGIAIAGTHGKTTTTAMAAWTLTALGQDPTFIVGGIVNNLGVNARAGNGPAFVIEADEYDRMFLGLKPRIAVVTNVEHDHPDCFPTEEEFRQAFADFVGLLPSDGTLIACADDLAALSLAQRASTQVKKVIVYSTGIISSLLGEWVSARNLQPNAKGGFSFDASVKGHTIQVALQVPGTHNVQNALAVLAIASVLKLDIEAAARALGEFSGAGRRFELRGEAQGVTVIDDYAHHPTEIRATLSAARSRFPGRRIWAVWQPHTYSRTRLLLDEFARSFSDADEVLVTEVYAAREGQQDFSASQVVQAMQHPSARFTARLDDTSRHLLNHLRSGDVVITLSAGDADQVSSDVLSHLRERETRNA